MFSVGNKLEFTEWLQSEMDKRAWSQSDLARSADLNRAVINKLLNGKTSPHPSTLAAIARAFRIPLETAYRAAGLLPKVTSSETILAEIAHIIGSIKNPQRKATALTLLRALITEEENEETKDNKK